MMSTASLVRSLLLALIACASTPPLVSSVPLLYTIPQRATECLYDKLDAGEHVTVSVFISSGAELKGTSIFEGPVAPADAASGTDVQNAIKQYQMGHRYGNGPKGADGNIRKEMTVDFEKDDWDDDDIAWDDDDEYDDDDYADDDVVVDQKKRSEKTKSAKEREEERRKRMEAKRKRYEARRAEKIRRHNRASEGGAIEQTYKAEVAGWYRACVRGSWYQITAEIEMRKESDLGQIDKKTGHVISYEKQAMLAEEKSFTADDGLKDKDLQKTHDQLRKLNRLLNEIKEQQQAERHRLSVHAATNEHSHSRMVLSSLMETILFMLITGFQVYTIRKWFSGAPMLGR